MSVNIEAKTTNEVESIGLTPRVRCTIDDAYPHTLGRTRTHFNETEVGNTSALQLSGEKKAPPQSLLLPARLSHFLLFALASFLTSFLPFFLPSFPSFRDYILVVSFCLSVA